MIRIAAITVILSITALIAVGCDSTTSEYIDGYNAAAEKMDAAGDSFTGAESVKDLTAARAELDDAVKDYDALTPPDSVKKDHDTMVKELQAASAAMAKVTDKSTDAADTAASAEATAHMDKAVAASDAIRKELNG